MRIKFACLNLWEGGRLFEEALSFLKSEQADILALQEAHYSLNSSLEKRWRSIEIIKQELGYPYHHFAPAYVTHDAPDQTPRGNAVLSRYPILSGDTIFYDIPYREGVVDTVDNATTTPRNLESAVVDMHGTKLNVFNTQGIWGWDGEDNERRLKMGDVIADSVKGKNNVILAGDFNVKENTQTMQKVEALLKNVFKGERTTSFNMRRKSNGGYATAVVDMIFVSRNIHVVEHSCPDVDVSDHLPLVAVIELDK